MLKHDVAATTSFSLGRYRPEIDGLRAIAIVAVVAFHAGVPYATGGYVGVDVFFVISGFLITGLLFRELEASGSIDIVNFYARRIRRLLPALIVVLVATLGTGWFFLTPIGEQQDLASSALATAGFVANIFFWRTQTGYFAGPAEQLPLLHMWTLAVEEQFYIVWPLVMLFVGKLAHRQGLTTRGILVAALIAGTIISLLASLWGTPVKTTLAFYLTPFRAWEFGVGGLLALLSGRWIAPRSSSIWGTLIAFAGLMAVLIAIFTFDAATLFPGYAALLPVLGSGALILGMSWSPAGAMTAWLKTSPMVGVGKLSYSWYLWHWPLLAIARATALGEHDLWLDLLLVTVALLLSALSYILIEQPVRQRRIWLNMTSWATILAGVSGLALSAALAGLLWGGAALQLNNDRMLQALTAAKSQAYPFPNKCKYFKLPFAGLGPVDGCTLGATKSAPMLVLWGDSHAYHYIPALTSYAKQADIRLLPRAMGACKPYTASTASSKPGVWQKSAQACVDFNKAMRSQLAQLQALGASHVILSAQWALPSTWQQKRGDWEVALTRTIKAIHTSGLRVILFADIPDYKWNVADCIARRGLKPCSRRRDDVIAQNAAALSSLKSIAEKFDNVRLWDPVDELCPRSRKDGSCLLMKDGAVLYSDNQHLSVVGAQLLTVAIRSFLNNTRTQTEN